MKLRILVSAFTFGLVSIGLLAASVTFGKQVTVESLPVPEPVHSSMKVDYEDDNWTDSNSPTTQYRSAEYHGQGHHDLNQLSHQPHIHHSSFPTQSTNPAGIRFVLARNNEHYACPLRILHVPYGAWIEIEGSYYQHKNFDNTMDVCVHFHLPHSVFPPTVIIKTASSPREIRLSETSMSETVQLVPGMTVEFDYARVFGDRLRKNPSKNELAHMAAYQSSIAYESRLQPAEQVLTKQPDQISSINVETYPQAARLIWVRTHAGKYDSDPQYLYLFRLTGSEQVMKSIATKCYVEADIRMIIKNFGTWDFKDVKLAGTLVNGRTLSFKRQAASFEVQVDFFEAVNSGSEFGKFLVAINANCTAECQLSNIRIVPTNGTLDGNPFSSIPPITTTESSVLKLEVIVKQ